MAAFRHHLFVCTNQRPPGMKAACGGGDRNPDEIFQALVDAVNVRGLWYDVMVSTSGCVGACANGPTIVVYPDAIWYSRVTLADVDEIVREHMLGGRPVERLIHRWPDQYRIGQGPQCGVVPSAALTAARSV